MLYAILRRMKGTGIIITLGIFVSLSPFMGLPGVLRDKLVVVLGLMVVLIAFYARQRMSTRISGSSQNRDHKPYAQNEIIDGE